MMHTVNIHEAKTHLSQFIAEVMTGEKIIIAKSGKPVAILSPYVEEKFERTGGQFKGIITMSEDFDAPLPEEISKAFKGEGK